MVFVAGDAQDLQVEANCAATLVPGNNVICFTLLPVQVMLFQASWVCASAILLSQDLATKPWWDTAGV
jgi:hypothetical protein